MPILQRQAKKVELVLRVIVSFRNELKLRDGEGDSDPNLPVRNERLWWRGPEGFEPIWVQVLC